MPEKAFAIFTMLAILSILIIVHECGHFLLARLFGFQTPVFGFGLPFGPYVSIGRRWKTEFRIYAMVLGGFVAIPELGDESNVSEEVFGLKLEPFKKFPIWQRMIVAFAGVGFNILFAYLVMLVMLYSIGKPIPGAMVTALPSETTIAARAGVLPKDELVSINDTPMTSPEDVVAYLGGRKNTPVVLHMVRAGKPLDLPMTTNDEGRVGMQLGGTEKTKYEKVEGSPLQMAGMAAGELSSKTWGMMQAMGGMFANLVPKPQPKGAPPKAQPGIQDFHGVLAVIKIGADIAQQDWRQLYMFTILISMDLAIVNLLPWPALDGGHLAFMTIEAIRRRPMEEKFQGEIVKWGFLSLLALMVVVMVNDVTALVTGKLDMKSDKDKEKGAATQTVAPAAKDTPAPETK
ncbi:MAG: site-2 protease family protein [Cyanobacteria bacterium SZAS LIN-2]|nr:site-2 protease family protein [Cyanobacteria bacterium SZAS LIN-3]MBS1999470.1 site-2 protease family protein [Cyanobacteria bacterium SZAS LIN-2]MBS2009262.1 site-2 protease family protein [Cyanobacteria bacterium SZAS TMP-1]